MSRPDDAALRLSLVDRLLDEDRPSLAVFRNSIRRDLEDLLNTRQRVLGWPAALAELDASLLNFGVADLSTTNMSTEQRRADVVKGIGAVIRQWEPRLSRMRVSALPNINSADRSLRIRIEAEITVEHETEHAIFDTMIDPLGNSISLKTARRD